MAHRAEEKERRRRERIEREEAARRAAARKRTLQLGAGVVGGLVIIAVIVVLVAGGGGGGDDKVDPNKLTADAKAAGCTFTSFKSEGRTHTAGKVTYKTNPPTSGNHNPDWYQDGIYNPGDVPRLGMLVHPLEHGRIEVQYKPGTPQNAIDQLEALVGESDGYHMLMFQNTTGMQAQVAATAWGHSLTCPKMNDQVFDAIRTFRTSYIDKGPEAVP
jgi:hypothetical protein